MDYSEAIAPVGQLDAHVPQSIQESGLISYLPSPCEIAPTGHSPSQEPQETHESEITNAMSVYLLQSLSMFESILIYI